MTGRIVVSLSCLAGLFAAQSAFAADEATDPDWPCQQQLVPKIEAAQVWSGPLPDANVAMTAPPELSDLGRSVMNPTLTDDNAVKLIKDHFAKIKDHKKAAGEAPTVFIVALTEANAQRTREISGIKNFTKGQFALSKKLAEDVAELDKLTGGQPAIDGTPAKQVEDRVHITQRVFEDREKQVRYLCDAPSTGEARIGAVARTLATYLGNGSPAK